MTDVLDFPRINTNPLVHGLLRSSPEDFVVDEIFSTPFSGEGEHIYVFIEKTGQNTEYVAKQLARYLGVREMDVSFSGLKDRWAVTRQWFSVYTSNKELPAIEDWDLDGVKVLEQTLHNRKLRRGEHSANEFRIVVRGLSALSEQRDRLEGSLQRVQREGVPNYFGVQRFGRDGQNLARARKWFAGEIKASRSQRSFYLSAARSYLFNTLLARKINNGEWLQGLDGDGPLYGDPAPDVEPMKDSEMQFFSEFDALVKGLHKNRMTLARRPYRMHPINFSWQFGDDSIAFSFALPTGAFATSVLSEVFELEEVSHYTGETK